MALPELPPLRISMADVEAVDNLCATSVTDGFWQCASCGRSSTLFERQDPDVDTACFSQERFQEIEPGVNDALLNQSPISQHFCTKVYANGNVRVRVCNACRCPGGWAKRCLPFMPLQHAMRAALVPFERLHGLSFCDIGYTITRKACGYLNGQFGNESIIECPVLTNQRAQLSAEQEFAYQQVHDALNNNNALYQVFRPLVNRPDAAPIVLPREHWQHIATAHQRRDPVTDRHDNNDRHQYAVLDHFCYEVPKSDTGHRLGTVITVDAQTFEVKSNPLENHHMAQGPLGDFCLESLAFPYMFYTGTGHFTKEPRQKHNMFDYLRLRCLQAFTIFTKQTPYLLLLRSLTNMLHVLHSMPWYTVNKKKYDQLREENPEAEDSELLDQLIKSYTPSEVPGSPASFARGKSDLDQMVRSLGMPHYFATITMNETGDFSSIEYKAIEHFMKHWHQSFSWRDAPLECNRAFLGRFKHVWRNYIMAGPKILGPVKDWAMRFECQARGSLHVHIIIWLDPNLPAAVAATDRYIWNFVPAERDPNAAPDRIHEGWTPHHEPIWERLANHVRWKQQHTCTVPESGNKRACMRDGHCRMKFPCPIHESFEPELRDHCRRFKYACFRDIDRYTVCYVPELALLMDAHVNMVKVLDEEWSKYLMKYATWPSRYH